MAIFGERLKKLRVEKGITQDELGELLGYKRRMIYYLESGEREPNLETINKISEIFNCTTDYLLGKSDTIRYTWKQVREVYDNLAIFLGKIDENLIESAQKWRDKYPDSDDLLTREQVINIEKQFDLIGELYDKIMVTTDEQIDKDDENKKDSH